MIASPGDSIPREVDPLPTSCAGTALAGAASLLWPELKAATFSLAVVVSFIVWTRAVRTLRRRGAMHYGPGRLLPLAVLGGTGWSAALLVGPGFPEGGPLILGALSVGLYLLARTAFSGS